MSQNIIVSFALLYGASIALICAIYVFINSRNKKKLITNQEEIIE